MASSGLNLAQRLRAASAYRTILRSARFTFTGDKPTLSQFTSKTKTLFINSILNNQNNFNEEIDGVLEVSRYLRRNIVQGKHSDDGKRLGRSFMIMSYENSQS
ncbi:uncharacterized protein MELLADRAFT_108599 [Melampsora larici-populina 98AG31]|uniref:Mitochondrial zinc maintenance protein 1, mitochondrial n=1 Tax=Melampsora larici-populina (strain 98AG31 / pathotype 3-4-7) TaxID=747676 RepID=F4RTM1_MELLP|nr:uncharacterized protein MELLADRAFT_108599 [Melampsora larici-populina 98AG31]EGG04315.1 hypothetical protein MELLADRAFT_108599 [Melampsora larici-populina 98AG31]